MKKYIIIIIIFLSIYDISIYSQSSNYYYYKGEKNQLDIDYSRISVVSSNESPKKVSHYLDLQYQINRQSKINTKYLVTPLKQKRIIEKEAPIFTQNIELNKEINPDEYFKKIKDLRKNGISCTCLPPIYTKGTK